MKRKMPGEKAVKTIGLGKLCRAVNFNGFRHIRHFGFRGVVSIPYSQKRNSFMNSMHVLEGKCHRLHGFGNLGKAFPYGGLILTVSFSCVIYVVKSKMKTALLVYGKPGMQTVVLVNITDVKLKVLVIKIRDFLKFRTG